ncbi:MAG: bifunctional [glutamine synthetase] adenylyltransferase/[glutamine synthetase]-adenylyl-L-tyrosine phosphorylase [Pseudomonadota bacterium]
MLAIKPIADSPSAALAAAAEFAPYLRRVAERRPDIATRLAQARPGAVIDASVQALSALTTDDPSLVMPALRDAKAATHLAIAAGDLSRALSLADVTGAISAFADLAVNRALKSAFAQHDLAEDGLFIIALGKMGAMELNYSSDIDVAAFYDPEVFDGGRRSPGDAAARIVRDMVRVLEERTAEGYVFRTDLRLRPDPRSTPLAVSTRMAELYYESVGQNWERMVWIKARACAGDMGAAEDFVGRLQPFVWRRHLDYWAIGDIHAIKRQINAHNGHAALDEPDADVKLGHGGIREIEFFVQTQQLILGGRNEGLRQSETLAGLSMLQDAGVVSAEHAETLAAAYDVLRGVEHRIQMLNDEQTHQLPSDPEARASVAALCGAQDLSSFDRAVRETRRAVHEIYAALFEEEERRVQATGNLVFTGVDDDPGTVATLARFGFDDPPAVIETIRQWHRGRTPAASTARGRELLTALIPDLLRVIGETGEADSVFRRFAVFFEGLRSGVQTLSMLLAEPKLMADLIETLALAPRLATTLGRRPDLLEPLLDGSRAEPLNIAPDTPFETAMDNARRHHREQTFLIGHRLLRGGLTASEAGLEWSDLADEAIEVMAVAAEAETGRRFGAAPGPWAVCAMGRLGGREMTAGSDLDLMVIYDTSGETDGQTWFTRFTQRLISGLSAPTGEGELYEVDMRLRPSGRAGPVAVRLSAFDRYHREEAWTWEHMALTRLRPVAGDAALSAAVEGVARRTLSEPRDPAALRADVLDMRQRLARERPSAGLWDLKLSPGGLIDIEFMVQHALLASSRPEALQPSTRAALNWLGEIGVMTDGEVASLMGPLRLMQRLQQVLRLAVGDEFNPDETSAALKRRLAVAADQADFEGVEAALRSAKERVADIRCKKIGPLTTEP